MMTKLHNNFFLILVCLWIYNAFANSSGRVYPSEYAYLTSSVYKYERQSANCRLYPESGIATGVHTELYTHCDGTQLRLTDSDLGSEQFNSNDYYKWSDGKSSQLLFIFPTSIILTTITLHYYSDNVRGLPKLRFYAVPDDFNSWDAPSGSNNQKADIAPVPPDGEPLGQRNVSIFFNFTTKRVLLYKYKSDFAFYLSEVEFITCNGSMRININRTKTNTIMWKTTMAMSNRDTDSLSGLSPDASSLPNAVDSTINTITRTGKPAANDETASTDLKLIGIGIVIAIVILLFLTAITVITLVLYLRKSAQRKADYDGSYSTLCRKSVQQMQPQSLHICNDLYDQIQLSPSTGQAEFISTNETANTNNPPPHQNECGSHPRVDKNKHKSAKLKITASTISSQDEEKSTSEQPTYAVVNKKKKQQTEKESVHCPSQKTADQNVDVTEQNVVEDGNQPKQNQDGQETATQIPSHAVESPQELYTAVKKKPKARPAEDKRDAPPIPLYTVEELYTAVQKKPKAGTEENNNATQVLPHTMEELYTAVKKKPKVSTQQAEDEAPPIPAHTVEELYSAVQKKPKVNTTEDEEEAPPVPPHTLD